MTRRQRLSVLRDVIEDVLDLRTVIAKSLDYAARGGAGSKSAPTTGGVMQEALRSALERPPATDVHRATATAPKLPAQHRPQSPPNSADAASPPEWPPPGTQRLRKRNIVSSTALGPAPPAKGPKPRFLMGGHTARPLTRQPADEPTRPAAMPPPKPAAAARKPRAAAPQDRAEVARSPLTDLERHMQRLRAHLAAAVPSTERARADAAAGVTATPDEVALVGRRAAAGRGGSVATPRIDRLVRAVLGLDLGTSSAKIVVRLRHEAGAPAFAMPVPAFAQAEGHRHLWASRLWISAAGELSLTPISGANVLCGIKSGLMRAPNEILALSSGRVAATPVEAATAFLALLVQQARGWALTERSDAFGIGRLGCEYNIGFPAASLDDAGLRDAYATAIAAAMELASKPGPIDLAMVRAAIAAVGGDAVGRLAQLDVSLVPEITAAVTSFTQSPAHELGLYAMVDVGAGTLDCCTFNIARGNGQSELKTAIFVADVALLGVDAGEVCKGDATIAPLFAKQVRIHQQTVIWETKQRRYISSPRWRTELPVFLIGGGAAVDVLQRAAGALDAWLKGQTGARVRVRTLQPSAGLRHECEDGREARLVVADGLAYPRTDIPEVELPTSIEDQLPQARKDITDRYVSKDMM